MSEVLGRVHSFQSLATLDGPGVRFAVFLQGCHLRCGCCHNPDTWDIKDGKVYTAEEIVKKALRFKEYFGIDGGITLSGGEPLLQADFVREIFALSKKEGINTCLDTSGSILTGGVKAALELTDRVLLDIKYTDDEKYQRYVGCGIKTPLEFLSYLDKKGIPTTFRQVIIPSLNSDEENLSAIKEIVKKYKCIDKVELLPFKKICQVKYDKMGIEFPFASIPEPTKAGMEKLNSFLQK